MYLRSAPLQNAFPVPRMTTKRIASSRAIWRPAFRKSCAVATSSELNRAGRSMVMIPTAPSRVMRMWSMLALRRGVRRLPHPLDRPGEQRAPALGHHPFALGPGAGLEGPGIAILQGPPDLLRHHERRRARDHGSHVHLGGDEVDRAAGLRLAGEEGVASRAQPSVLRHPSRPEAQKVAVVDVEDPSGERAEHRRGEGGEIAHKHHQLDVERLEQADRGGIVLPPDREVTQARPPAPIKGVDVVDQGGDTRGLELGEGGAGRLARQADDDLVTAALLLLFAEQVVESRRAARGEQRHPDRAVGSLRQAGQHMRGRGTPSGSATGRRPTPGSSTTRPGSAATARPITAASCPSGWARIAPSTAFTTASPPRTPRSAFPSLAMWNGSRPSISAAARTVGRTGTRGSSITMPTPLFDAISWSALATPPRVGSFMALTGPAASAASTRRLSGATSESSSTPNSSSWRFAMSAMPWSPMVPVSRIASPGSSPASGTMRSASATPVVVMMIPSSSPRPITFVSPVTMVVPASAHAWRIESWIRSRSARRNPSSITIAEVRPSGRTAPIMARSLTVPDTARRPMSPPGKKAGCTTWASVVTTSHWFPIRIHDSMRQACAEAGTTI